MNNKIECGFYLSPNGKHIVEIRDKEKYFYEVSGYIGGFPDFIFDFFEEYFEVIFDCWHFLGCCDE